MADQIRETTAVIRESAATMNFEQDFPIWVAARKIVRYDLICHPFEPLDLSHPAFADIETNINVAIPPLFPVGLGMSEFDFEAEDPRELSVSRGKYLLLMEQKKGDWRLVMDPESYELGHVPADYIRQVGTQFAVVVGAPEEAALPAGVILVKGDYLAVTGPPSSDVLEMMTVKGKILSLPSKLVGIISSFSEDTAVVESIKEDPAAVESGDRSS
jgi:hypothetical protein